MHADGQLTDRVGEDGGIIEREGAVGSDGASAGDSVGHFLAELWEAVLEVPASTDGDFFSLGGNSLKAVRIVEAVESEYGFEFPLDVLFFDGRLPTVVAACQALVNAEPR